jgi:hypothetical protein
MVKIYILLEQTKAFIIIFLKIYNKVYRKKNNLIWSIKNNLKIRFHLFKIKILPLNMTTIKNHKLKTK